MEKARRDLKSVSIILIVLGVIDLIGTFIMIFSPNATFSAEALMQTKSMTADEANATIVLAVIFGIIGFLLQLFIGLKGVIIANGGKKSTFVIVLVVISILFLVLGGSSSVGSIIDGTTNVLGSQIIMQVCEILLLLLYIYFSNTVIKLRKTNV